MRQAGLMAGGSREYVQPDRGDTSQRRRSYAPTAARRADAVLSLQRSIGNAAVAEVLHRRARALDGRGLARQAAPAPTAEPVTFQSFDSSGTSLQGHALGFRKTTAYAMNAVQLRFAVDEGQRRYRNLTCRQWGGPEAVYVKRGNALTAPWSQLSRGPGVGADHPEPESVTRRPGLLAYYDSPGPNLGPMVAAREGRPSRVYVVQNFTGWVEGMPAAGGDPQRITPIVSWNSVIHLVDENSGDHDAPPRYEPWPPTGAGQGWASLEPPQI